MSLGFSGVILATTSTALVAAVGFLALLPALLLVRSMLQRLLNRRPAMISILPRLDLPRAIVPLAVPISIGRLSDAPARAPPGFPDRPHLSRPSRQIALP